jgi:hypothetical protein
MKKNINGRHSENLVSLRVGVTLITTSIFILILFLSIMDSPSFAQNAGGLEKLTNGTGSIKVRIEPSPFPIKVNTQIGFKSSFLQPKTGKVQPHIDYNLEIISSKGKTIFDASNQTGQPGLPIHTAEGIVSIPYNFQTIGDYTVKVTVFGILFNPIKPESALFSIKTT